MSIIATTSRSWNGTPIQRRRTDGYVNATAMCKANGKRWGDFRESNSSTTYAEALSRKTGIPVYNLMLSKPGDGTWVHPDIATELARWISPDFSVFVNQWFREEFEKRVEQANQNQPSPASTSALPGDVLTYVDRSIDLLERLGGVDDRAQMILRDVVINATLTCAGGSVPALTASQELTISEFLIELGCPSHHATRIATKIGREVKGIYRAQNGRDPKQQPQLVGGRRCQVAIYERSWLIERQSDFQDAIQEHSAN